MESWTTRAEFFSYNFNIISLFCSLSLSLSLSLIGYANCPRFAKIELLCDQLSISLPSFAVHKIVKHPSEWNSWLENVCAQNSWSHDKGIPVTYASIKKSYKKDL